LLEIFISLGLSHGNLHKNSMRWEASFLQMRIPKHNKEIESQNTELASVELGWEPGSVSSYSGSFP
jgi:hypothetical protein